MFKALWNDDAGIVTLEYLILATIVALGLIVGVTVVVAAMNSELGELAEAIGALDQGYSTTGFAGVYCGAGVSSVDGSDVTDSNDEAAINTVNASESQILECLNETP